MARRAQGEGAGGSQCAARVSWGQIKVASRLVSGMAIEFCTPRLRSAARLVLWGPLLGPPVQGEVQCALLSAGAVLQRSRAARALAREASGAQAGGRAARVRSEAGARIRHAGGGAGGGGRSKAAARGQESELPTRGRGGGGGRGGSPAAATRAGKQSWARGRERRRGRRAAARGRAAAGGNGVVGLPKQPPRRVERSKGRGPAAAACAWGRNARPPGAGRGGRARGVVAFALARGGDRGLRARAAGPRMVLASLGGVCATGFGEPGEEQAENREQ
jgi:hypothetical protein